MTKTEAFRRLGAKLKNTRDSWPALKVDGSGVVVTAWRDRFDWHAKPVTYDGSFRTEDAASRHGARERIEHLRVAVERFEGIVHVVCGTARDQNASVRQGENWDVPRFAFRITSFDDVTGAFRAEVMDRRVKAS